ncbi:hypothetical protein IWX90DRAFT_86316 [Phyllosticta citrichinensis]|uniref:Ubiquitin-like protease family profile domain-containing protein n=1 Tax=Phyllosticta citrichinensis TaxID=1130410 RepID=A0ABR1XFB6_9PEZI
MPPWNRQDFQAKLDSTVHRFEATAVAELAPLRRQFDATAPHSDDASFDSLLPAHVSRFIKGIPDTTSSSPPPPSPTPHQVGMAAAQKERFRDRIARAWSITRDEVDSKFPPNCGQGFLQNLATFSERHSSYEQVFPILEAAKEQRINRGKDTSQRDGIQFPFSNGTSKTKLWQPVDVEAADYLIQQNGKPQPQHHKPTPLPDDKPPAPMSTKPHKRRQPSTERADTLPGGKRRRVSSSFPSPEHARRAPDAALPDDALPEDEIQNESSLRIPGYKSESAGSEAPDLESSDEESPLVQKPGSETFAKVSEPKDTPPSPGESDGVDALSYQPRVKDPKPDQQACGFLEIDPLLESYTFSASGVAQGESDQPQQLYDCLNPGRMLNDHVVNKATSLLTCPDGSIETLDSVVTSGTPKVFSKSTRLVYAPFFHGSHWMLLQLDLKAQGVSFFNSTSTTALANAAQSHVFSSILSPRECSAWVFVERSSLQQDNTVDCGIFLLIYLAYSMVGLCLPTQDIDVTLWRVTMSLLLRGKLPSFTQDDKQVQHNGISIADTENKKHNVRTTLHTAYDLANIFKVLYEKCAPGVRPLEAAIQKLQVEVEAREQTLQSVKSWPTCALEIEKMISDSIQGLRSELRKAKARRDNLQQVVDNGARIRRYMDKVVQKSKKRMQELEGAED